MIAGFGARLAMGCNLAAFFDWHSAVFATCTVLCHRHGHRFLFRREIHSTAAVSHSRQDGQSQCSFTTDAKTGAGTPPFPHRYAGLFCDGCMGYLHCTEPAKLGLAMLFGVGFGLLIERAQICFTSAFRDMWITGRTMMAKAIIAGMAVSAIGIFSYVQLGVEPKIMWAGPNAVIGGLLFGFGIVLAGGCETGWMYRAVEGQVHYWWVGLGNVIGSTIWHTTGMTCRPCWRQTGTRSTC